MTGLGRMEGEGENRKRSGLEGAERVVSNRLMNNTGEGGRVRG
jgi:hypothetical protein